MKSVTVTGRGSAPFVVSVGLAAAVVVTVVAAIWPAPGRHVHGLLVVISLTLVAGVAGAGLRVVAAERRRAARESREVTDGGSG
ncbi:hypothetical protein [Frankia sp. CiP1_Cm_nod2]|uniref:hypothetical protein n=1 Tax=Frankia sp. CiP1_Cm_nod2 TaxID=2897161 RepID=UPI002023E954